MSDHVSHVVAVVFDGLRPDHVRPDLTPNILRLAARGARHARAYSVFPSLTRVASATLSTGALPRDHGIMGNLFWNFPACADEPLDTSKFEHLQRLLATDARGAITIPTLGQRLAQAGKRMAVVHSGSAGSAYLLNPTAGRDGHWTFSIHGREHTVTPGAVDAMTARFGPLPKPQLPRFAQMDYGTTVFVEHVLTVMRPEVAVLWLPEPDTSYHYLEIGSKQSMSALRHADACLGRVLDHLEGSGEIERTAVMVLSDHGQITVTEEIPIYDRLRAAGFKAAASGGDALIAGTSGNSAELRLRIPDDRLRDRLADFLAEQPEVGAVFSPGRNEVEGVAPHSLAMELLGFDHDRMPDLAFVMTSTDGPDHAGTPGLGQFMGGKPINGGMHGGLNRHEMAVTMIMAGPGVAEGKTIDDPAGLQDVAPTILALLGLPVPASMTGRPLWGLNGRANGHDNDRGEIVTERFSARLGGREQFVERLAFAGGRYLVRGGLA